MSAIHFSITIRWIQINCLTIFFFFKNPTSTLNHKNQFSIRITINNHCISNYNWRRNDFFLSGFVKEKWTFKKRKRQEIEQRYRKKRKCDQNSCEIDCAYSVKIFDKVKEIFTFYIDSSIERKKETKNSNQFDQFKWSKDKQFNEQSQQSEQFQSFEFNEQYWNTHKKKTIPRDILDINQNSCLTFKWIRSNFN